MSHKYAKEQVYEVCPTALLSEIDSWEIEATYLINVNKIYFEGPLT